MAKMTEMERYYMSKEGKLEQHLFRKHDGNLDNIYNDLKHGRFWPEDGQAVINLKEKYRKILREQRLDKLLGL